MKYSKIPVLLYHSIVSNGEVGNLNLSDFERQISFLYKHKYNSVHLNEINPSSKNQIVITFDDGYKDIITNVLPILKKYGFKATCFIVSNYLGKYNDWDLENRNYQKKELMNKNDIIEWIKNGMNIGSHSHNHKNLTTLNEKDLKNEIFYSKKFLENLFSIPINDFCYPYGQINSLAFNYVKEKYINGYTTNRSRFNLKNHDPHLIPRIDMGKKISNIKIFLKLNTLYEDIKYNKNEI